MDAAWLVPAALGFGLAVGVGASAAVVFAHARGQRAAAVVSPSVPDGVEEVIDALETAGIVLDASNNVVTCSTAAVARTRTRWSGQSTCTSARFAKSWT